MYRYVNSLLVLQNSTTARKSGNIILTYLKAFFVRHSSEYKTSDSDRKVNRNIYPDAVTRDRMRLKIYLYIAKDFLKIPAVRNTTDTSYRKELEYLYNFSVQDMNFSVQDMNFSEKDMNFSVQDMSFSVQGMNFSVQDMNFSVQGMNFSVQGMNFSVQDKHRSATRNFCRNASNPRRRAHKYFLKKIRPFNAVCRFINEGNNVGNLLI